MSKKFIIMAHRSARSLLGEKHAPLVDKEGIIKFDTFRLADTRAKELQKGLTTTNVTYTAQEEE